MAGSHCVNPPTPESKYKLKLVWNSNYPPAHGQTVMYVCNAGNSWNRFENNFNKWNLTLTCLEDNKFAEVEWPTCVNGKISSKCLIFVPNCIQSFEKGKNNDLCFVNAF